MKNFYKNKLKKISIINLFIFQMVYFNLKIFKWINNIQQSKYKLPKYVSIKNFKNLLIIKIYLI